MLAAAWGQNYWMIILIIGITSWPGTARVIRSDTLRVRAFVRLGDVAAAVGMERTHLYRKLKGLGIDLRKAGLHTGSDTKGAKEG